MSKLETKVVIDEGSIYGLGYSFESRGSAIMARIPVTEEFKKTLIQRAVETAAGKVADQLAQELATEFRRTAVREVNKEIRQYLKEHKKTIIDDMVKQAKKTAVAKLKETESYYD